MEHLGLNYYAGLMTASDFHGASHQIPMVFQVMVERPRRMLRCGRIRVRFVVRKQLDHIPTENISLTRAPLPIVTSTPEATAIDLVGYAHRAAGIDNVATIITEMGERIDPDLLVKAAATAPVTWAQRLGHVMEYTGHGERAVPLKDYVKSQAKTVTPLQPGMPLQRIVDDGWKLDINHELDPDL
ncbi:MAG: type IV toxin-antitoxin system AbiEi family antitoxin [Parvularculales bacterium]